MGILCLVPPAHYPRPIRHSRPIMPSAYLAYYAQCRHPIILGLLGPICLLCPVPILPIRPIRPIMPSRHL